MQKLLLVIVSSVLLFGCGQSNSKNVNRVVRLDRKTNQALREDVFQKEYGDKTKQPVIFIHGGPGVNSVDFEYTTAQLIASLGYRVLVYDQRGQGRSGKTNPANYNYQQYANDLHQIIATRKMVRPIIIAHSHGGPIAIQYEKLWPKEARAIILVSAPLHMWNAFTSLHDNCGEYYKKNGMKKEQDDLDENFRKIKTATKDNPEAVAAVFVHGIVGCKLANTEKPTAKEEQLRKMLKNYPSPVEASSMPGFLKNEDYLTKDHTELVKSNKGRFFAIYGKEDHLFSDADRGAISAAVDPSRFTLISGAGHSVYIDQQDEFMNAFKNFVSAMPK